MAEYIERGARLQEIDDAFKEYAKNGDMLKLFSECRASIIFAPAADVAKVRNGEWLRPTVVDGRPFDIPHCSVCGDVPCDTKNYCPAYGAKMDGKGEGE